ncbi:MAG: SufD family Fe-S cluster assembly protein [Burkholderiaceae bacterium]|nr:SufD family Fe-S cluster assembly protein [Burkholderiaceae bacterium]
MNTARADALAAREQIATQGWIARSAEAFRHLPPPAAEVWLGGEAGALAAQPESAPIASPGWTLDPVGQTPQGVVEARWLDAGDPKQRAELFDGLPLPGDDADAAPFGWAHRALCRDGLRLRVGGDGSGDGAGGGNADIAADASSGADQRSVGDAPSSAEPVWLRLRHESRESVEAPLLVLEVAAGVRCVLVESHDAGPADAQRDPGDAQVEPGSEAQAAQVQNLQVHLRLGEGATLHHLRIAAPGARDSVAHHLHARLDRGARYVQALIASGSGYHLQRNRIDLQGERASASLAGVLFAPGSAIEQQVRVEHEGTHTSSDVEALVLASGAARAVVNAHTRIAPGADESQVRQRLSGIPTGGQPRLVLRPHLEIHHDNVQAAHGATWGAVPEDALFYARQRGLDEQHARALIIEGMASALLQRSLGEPELVQALEVDALLRRVAGSQFDGAHAALEVRHG